MSKKVLITGSTDGIGQETARALASQGYDIIIHGRSPRRVEDTVLEIERSHPEIRCEGLTADFSSLNQVREMIKKIKEKQIFPDILINNAGIVSHRFTLSADGYELTLQVNHLAHFYLTLSLLNHLPEPARIINVTSMVHASSINFETLNDKTSFDGVNAYSLSKLCNVLFTYKLDRLVKGKRDITVNCLHPGVINTKVLTETWGAIGSPVGEGARMPLYLATSPEVENISGAYFRDGLQQPSAAISYDEKIQDECWKRSLEMLYNAGFEPEGMNGGWL